MNARPKEARIVHYRRFLRDTRGLEFVAYDALWRWSTTELDAFWASIWDYFDIQSPTPYTAVLAERRMPGAVWFPGAQINYAQQVLRHADRAHAAGCDAVLFQDEAMLAAGQVQRVSWPDLRAQVGALAAQLRRAGIGPGDRVVAYLANRPEAVAAFLACASVGAVWSLCSPDMGPMAVLDRWRQIEPKLLIACDGYRWAGIEHDRRAVVDQLRAELPTLRTVWRASELPALMADAADSPVEPQPLPFDHPLWIVYSSGTTGLPKAIVHGHGGVMIEKLKLHTLHGNLGPSAETGDRFHWFSSTGWIMWNAQVGALLCGSTICLFDGNPGGPQGSPDWTTLWRFASATGATFVGAGAAFYASCLKAGVEPQAVADLSALRAVGSTGSPLSAEGYRWLREQLPKVDGQDIWVAVIAGGTDFASAFLAGLPTLPVVDGEMQCRALGAAVEAWNEAGEPLIDEVGELVCTAPLPSMPLYFLNDPGGQRLHDSYFDVYPGVWRHGDWLKITPHPEACGAIIYGRSDATINRHGIRMGTAELYRAVEALPEVLDSLVVDLEYLGRESYMPLFVVLRDGTPLDDTLVKRIKRAIREALSARHVPNEVFAVSAIPRTLSGKKMELPVKKLLLGADPDAVLKRDAMANAECVAWFVEFAQQRAARA